MAFQDYTLIPDEKNRLWKTSNSGEIAVAQKSGTRYRVKLYRRYPPSREGTPDYDGDVRACRAIFRRLKKVNEALRAADGGSGSIAYATEVMDNTKGDDKGIIEAVPLVVGGSDLSGYKGSREARLRLILSLAEAVQKIHAVGVRHSDLKLENVLCVVHGDTPKAVVIDFDHSYMDGDVPMGMDIGGTEGYQAPEILDYIDFCDEHERELRRAKDISAALRKQLERYQKNITLKVDIYALGVIFYLLLAEKSPYVAGEVKVDWSALDGTYLCELIEAMLSTDPKNRPDAEAVAESLRTKRFIREIEEIQPVWPEHEEYEYDLRATGREVVRICRTVVDGENMYSVTFRGNPSRVYSFQMMLNLQILKNKRAKSLAAKVKELMDARNAAMNKAPELWPEDSAYRMDEEKMRAFGYVRFTRSVGERFGRPVNQYTFYRSDGTEDVKSRLMAIMQGFLVAK